MTPCHAWNSSDLIVCLVRLQCILRFPNRVHAVMWLLVLERATLLTGTLFFFRRTPAAGSWFRRFCPHGKKLTTTAELIEQLGVILIMTLLLLAIWHYIIPGGQCAARGGETTLIAEKCWALTRKLPSAISNNSAVARHFGRTMRTPTLKEQWNDFRTSCG